MTEDVMVAKITEHDKHLDSLSNAVNSLATTTSKTNDKLDKVIDVMAQQNVLIEKMSNLSMNLDTVRDAARATERVLNSFPAPEEVKTSIKITDGLPTSTTIRWAVGILIGYLAISGNYIIGHIHMLESELATHKKVDELITADFSNRTTKLESSLDRGAK